MFFELNDVQQDLQSSLRRFFSQEAPLSATRDVVDTAEGYDVKLWNRMVDELGLTALAVPEHLGGLGASFVELVVVLEEMGRNLVCAPFLASAVLATRALLHSGDEEAQARYVPDLAAGRLIATLAVTEDSGSWDLATTATVAEPVDGGFVLDGVKSFVPDGHSADVIMVAAQAPAGLSLFAVAADAAGLTWTALPVLDGTRRLARMQLARTPAVLIGTEGGAGATLDRTLADAAVALAAEQVGGAQYCLDAAVAYARTRTAFGRPIGSFQVVKHKCADLFLGIESARSTVLHAAWLASVDSAELAFAAPMTKAHCSDVYLEAARENIQIHGAIGFTWEHDAHLHLKRAGASYEMLGAPDHHRDRIARDMGL